MYSNEDLLRAVELYFKHGKKVVQIVRELGYPSTKQLRRCVQAWQTRDVLVERVRRKPRYTDMQKHAAVEHYLKQGCCLAFTCRTLGYPSDVLLSRWVDELHPGRHQILSNLKNLHAPFDTEVKRQAVSNLSIRSASAREIAQKVGVSRQQLYKWKDELIGNEDYLAMRKNKELSTEKDRDSLLDEVTRLKQQILRQQMELDILNKAEELIKKDRGISAQSLTNREKTLFLMP